VLGVRVLFMCVFVQEEKESCGLWVVHFWKHFYACKFFWVLRNFASSLKSFVKGLFEKGPF
jgi:hypothetical protein